MQWFVVTNLVPRAPISDPKPPVQELKDRRRQMFHSFACMICATPAPLLFTMEVPPATGAADPAAQLDDGHHGT
jgi:hypothetical protein